ncbi:hypothetical protein [Staphylococcus kloosii]|jgi:hypothetical protein|uniref:DUF1270 domain-containing protein n=1 Tax=Staphylococcus kloosii TaxID=29384 RepID=A0ABQ0XJ07_9STAP|nr:hypothetical protein [Staphylococcus kloosii]MBF7022522.1 hypothetical protein [Staphylococcus kloosii]GEP81443.1 hypothetical protein SKL01_06210 [Staphylococcus kloosii]SUM49710.1 Uncharacterised protein [Staphylococcus kloosii]
MNKSFYIAFTAWMVFTLALMLIGVYFTSAIFTGTVLAVLTYAFFDKYFFANKKTAS